MIKYLLIGSTKGNFLLPLGFGIGLIYLVIYSKRKFRKKEAYGIKVDGTVVSWGSHPEIRFVTKDNKVIKKSVNTFYSLSHFLDFSKGDKVIVVYNPSNPSDFVFKRSSDKYFAAAMLFFGFLFLILGLYLIIGIFTL